MNNILRKTIGKQNLKDNAAKFKKQLNMNVGSHEAQIEMQQDTILNNTNKWTTEMKINLKKIEEHKRNWSRGFIKTMKKASDNI